MPKLLVLKGLPASGKSTYAKTLVEKGWMRTNKDDLRATINGKWSRNSEPLIVSIRDSIVRMGLNSGRNVVVDDTNLHPSHPVALKAIAEECGAAYEEKFFEITVEEAIKRDLQRPVSVGAKVIQGMYNDYLKPVVPQVAWDATLPPAIIVDIDGTLAHMHGRSPYDQVAEKYLEDTLDVVVSDIVIDRASDGDHVIVCSGRSEDFREVTLQWLYTHKIMFDTLLMRPSGDIRNDSVVKQELYEQNIKGEYNVRFVLDDRDRVVQMWRDQGLKCLQVAPGDF